MFILFLFHVVSSIVSKHMLFGVFAGIIKIIPQTAELWGSYHAVPNRIPCAEPRSGTPRCPAVPGGARCMQKPKEKQGCCGAWCKNLRKSKVFAVPGAKT